MNTILIADDEDSLRLLIRTTLDSPEYTLLEAPDGITALEVAKRELPDLIVLDWAAGFPAAPPPIPDMSK